MRKIVFLAFVLATGLAAAAGAQTFVGVLNGANEFPGPGDADGFGLAGFRFEGTTVTYNILVQHLNPPTASHIHRGAAGVAGPVVITLASSYPNNFASGTATASAALIDEIRRNPSAFYVNVHTGDFPGGAIRSQLSTGAFAVATGANEFPGPGDTDGLGMGVFTLSGTTLTYNALVQNIAAPTASHIHRGAPGVAGPVVITLASSYPGDRATGTATVTQELLEEILGNPSGFYFNVHNADFGGGAIRGQLALEPFTEVYYFPVVGHADGVNNTRFVADVRAVNTGTTPASLTLEYFASSPGGLSAPTAVKAVSVAPGAEVVINDVVASQFSTTGLGALKLGASSAMPTGVRVFNDLRPINGGTTGFSIRPKGISDAATSSTLLFLSQASPADIQAGLGFRTNIGCFNPNLIATPATFTAHRASDGSVLGSVNVVIPALLQVQDPAFQLISTVPAADQAQTDFYVTWTSTLPIYIYGAVVDNRTGDVVYVD
jgi:hypothetical protein